MHPELVIELARREQALIAARAASHAAARADLDEHRAPSRRARLALPAVGGPWWRRRSSRPETA